MLKVSHIDNQLAAISDPFDWGLLLPKTFLHPNKFFVGILYLIPAMWRPNLLQILPLYSLTNRLPSWWQYVINNFAHFSVLGSSRTHILGSSAWSDHAPGKLINSECYCLRLLCMQLRIYLLWECCCIYNVTQQAQKSYLGYNLSDRYALVEVINFCVLSRPKVVSCHWRRLFLAAHHFNLVLRLTGASRLLKSKLSLQFLFVIGWCSMWTETRVKLLILLPWWIRWLQPWALR